jgi:hypothetical protein
MPHFFFKLSADSPNPGRWTRERVKAVSDRHRGKLSHVWYDDPDSPTVAYVLIEDGDRDGLEADLAAHEVLTLHEVR